MRGANAEARRTVETAVPSTAREGVRRAARRTARQRAHGGVGGAAVVDAGDARVIDHPGTWNAEAGSVRLTMACAAAVPIICGGGAAASLSSVPMAAAPPPLPKPGRLHQAPLGGRHGRQPAWTFRRSRRRPRRGAPRRAFPPAARARLRSRWLRRADTATHGDGRGRRS